MKVERIQLRHIANRMPETSARPLTAITGGDSGAAASLQKSDAPDPGLVLPSIGAAVYHWNIVTDRLTWDANAPETLRPLALEDIGAGLDYGALISPESSVSRYDAIMQSKVTDAGEGSRRGVTVPGVGNRLAYLASRTLPRALVGRAAALPYRRPE